MTQKRAQQQANLRQGDSFVRESVCERGFILSSIQTYILSSGLYMYAYVCVRKCVCVCVCVCV